MPAFINPKRQFKRGQLLFILLALPCISLADDWLKQGRRPLPLNRRFNSTAIESVVAFVRPAAGKADGLVRHARACRSFMLCNNTGARRVARTQRVARVARQV